MEQQTDQQLEIEDILANMEDLLEHGKSVPFSDKTMIDREEMFDLITDVRLKLPTEIERSKWVLDEKNRILVDAQHEAEEKIHEAEEERERMINEHEVTRKAYAQAEEIVENAKKVSKELRMGAKEYADDLLMQIEEQIEALSSFTEDRLQDVAREATEKAKEFNQIIQQKRNILQQNRKELNIHHE